jgi:PTH1 family peptidyl-tRNA hydrolase
MKQETWAKALGKSLLYVALFFVSQYVASAVAVLVVVFSAMGRGMEYLQAVEFAADTQYAVINETMLFAALLFLGATLLIKRRDFVSGCSFRKVNGITLISALILGLGCFWGANVLLATATNLLPAVQESQKDYMEQYEAIQRANPRWWADLLYACAVAPLIEEIICRGILYRNLKKVTSDGMFVLLSGVLFALIHGNLYQMVFTLPLGMLLAFLTCRTHSVWPAVVLHAGFNFGNYVVRIGDYLGFVEESPAANLAFYLSYFFVLFCFPLGIILMRDALKEYPSDSLFSRPATPAAPDFSERVMVTKERNDSIGVKGENMASPEYLIVGLGNPGEKYAQNRHNCGFMALDYIALRMNISVNRVRFRALTGEGMLSGKKVLLMKPQTFMNLSGESVREAAAFYKIPPEKILVIFDDISFQPGVFRIRKSGSAGGHNGVKSIIQCLSSDAFPRVKMGVGAPPPGWELMNWVLGNPSPEDMKKILASLEDVYDSAKHHAAGNLERAAALYNGKMHE